MIPAATNMTEVDSLPYLAEADATIGDPRWVMQALADTYSDRSMAAIREYSTNAWDAHVMDGHTDPIEVSLPGFLGDTFRVKDHGVGMTMETLMDKYVSFGISDKRTSNDTNGMLGIGCKSGVAYTNEFTVISVKDGQKTHAVIMRMPDWSIKIRVLAHERTKERNGTEIIIPVHNPDEFTRKAMDFYKYWLPGRVLVNGSPVKHEVGEKITDNLYNTAGYYNSTRVVMGNVPYRINNPSALFEGLSINDIDFVAYVDGGDVEFTNSREDLKYTDRTKATLRKVIVDLEKQILAQAKADIAAATSHAEAYKAWSKWTNMLGNDLFADLTFKGDKFSDDFPIIATRYEVYGGRYSTYGVNRWNISTLDNTMIVTDFWPSNVTSGSKIKVRDWLNHKQLSASYILFTKDKAIDNPWVDQSRIVSWQTVKDEAPKKAAQPRGASGRIPGSWDYFTIAGRETGKPLPATGEVYYVSLQRAKGKNLSHKMRLIDLKADAAVIIVPGNRMEKFLRENPKVKEFFKFVESHVVMDGTTLLSADAKAALDYDYAETEWLGYLDASKIDDPAWAKEVEVIKNKESLIKKYSDNLDLARTLGVWYSVKKYEGKQTQPMLKKYPLLNNLNRYGHNKGEIYVYLNAKYQALQAKAV